MKVSGIKHLNKNSYSSLSITNKSINVKSKDQFETIKTSIPFSKKLKGITDEEKTALIIDYFLEYSTISKVKDYYYGGVNHLYIETINGKKLICAKPIDDKIMQKILDKYFQDRIETLFNEKVDEYEFDVSFEESSYDKKGNTRRIFIRENELINEKEFLEMFISSLFGNEKIEIKANYYHDNINNDFYYFDAYYLIGCNKKVKIYSSKIIKIIKEIIDKHNIEIEKNQKLQLKMEGF